MKKSTLVLLGVVLVLGVATWLVTRPAPKPATHTLVIAGYAPADKLAEQKNKGMLDTPVKIDYPVDAIHIERPADKETGDKGADDKGADGTEAASKDADAAKGPVVLDLARTGTGDDLAWKLTKPLDAAAVKYVVEKMIRPFETETRSVYSKVLAAGEGAAPDDAKLKRYGLDTAHRLRVTLKAGGAVWGGVDFFVGKAVESDSEAAEGGKSTDTWVAKASEPGVVYRVAGKDLRKPFLAELSALRDKKVFTIEPNSLVRVELTAPGGEQLVLSWLRKEIPPPAGASEDAKKKKKYEVTWRLAKPAGVPLDSSADSLARSITGLRTRDFVARADAPKEALEALAEGKSWHIVAKPDKGDTTYSLRVAAGPAGGSKAGDDKTVWAAVDGSDEVLKLDSWTADNLRKTLADLRDRKFIPVDASAVTGVTFAPKEGAKGAEAHGVQVEKKGAAWQFVAPSAGTRADLSATLKTVVSSRASRYAYPDELKAAEAALAKPEFKAVVAAGAQRWEVVFGVKMDDDKDAKGVTHKGWKGQRWGRVVALGADANAAQPSQPFLVQDYTVGRFRKGVDDLRNKSAFGFAKDAVQHLSIAWPDGKTTVELERPPAEGGAAKPLALVSVPKGKKAKTMALTTIESTLAAVRAKDFVSDKKPADVGLTDKDAYVLTATLGDGKTAKLLISEQTKGSDPYATTVGGLLDGQVVTINRYQADNLEKKPADLFE